MPAGLHIQKYEPVNQPWCFQLQGSGWYMWQQIFNCQPHPLLVIPKIRPHFAVGHFEWVIVAVEAFHRLTPEHEHRTWITQCSDSERNIIKEKIKSNINRQQSDQRCGYSAVPSSDGKVTRCVVQPLDKILGLWSRRFIWNVLVVSLWRFNLLTKLQSFWSTFVWALDSGHGGSVLVTYCVWFGNIGA